MGKNNFYFAFGRGQHPGVGYYTTVVADGPEKAVKIMEGRNTPWSQYFPTKEAGRIKENKMKEVFWDGVEYSFESVGKAPVVEEADEIKEPDPSDTPPLKGVHGNEKSPLSAKTPMGLYTPKNKGSKGGRK